MDNLNKNLVGTLNKINSTINGNDQKKWAALAASKCYKHEIEQLNRKMDGLKVSNTEIDNDIKELTIHTQSLEKMYKTITASIPISYKSLIICKMHEDNLNKMLNDHKEKEIKLVDQITRRYDESKEKLAKNNPTYQVLSEKQNELRKINFNTLKLEHDIKETERNKNYKSEIRQKLFYTGCIKFADAWLKKQRHDESVKKIEEIGKTEKKLLKELFELNIQIKEKQKLNSIKRNVQNTEATDNALKKLMFAVPASPKNDPPRPKIPSKNSFNTVRTLLHPQNQNKNSNYFANTQYNAVPPAKINILENHVVQSPKRDIVVKKIDAINKEEKTKVLEAKLQNVVQNFRARSQSQLSRKRSLSFDKRSAEIKSSVCKSRLERESTVVTSVATPMTTLPDHSESGNAREMKNLDALSQETSNILNLLSQESNKNIPTKLTEFKYDIEMVQVNSKKESKADEIMSTNNDQEQNLNYKESKINYSAAQQFSNKIEINTANSKLKAPNEKAPECPKSNDILLPCKEIKPSDGSKSDRNTPISMISAVKDNKMINQTDISGNIVNSNVNMFQQFSNNSTKLTDNHNFAMNIPFFVGSVSNPFKAQPEQYPFVQNKMQKISSQQIDEVNITEKSKMPDIAHNVLSSTEKNSRMEEGQYYFGGTLPFMVNTSEDGDFNRTCVLSPEYNTSLLNTQQKDETSNMEMPFSSNMFGFGQTENTFFNFN